MFSAAWVSVEGCLSDEIETSTGRVTLDCLIATLQSPVLGLRLRPRLLALAVSCEAVFLLDAGSESSLHQVILLFPPLPPSNRVAVVVEMARCPVPNH